jgi:hypothetical protein
MSASTIDPYAEIWQKYYPLSQGNDLSPNVIELAYENLTELSGPKQELVYGIIRTLCPAIFDLPLNKSKFQTWSQVGQFLAHISLVLRGALCTMYMAPDAITLMRYAQACSTWCHVYLTNHNATAASISPAMVGQLMHLAQYMFAALDLEVEKPAESWCEQRLSAWLSEKVEPLMTEIEELLLNAVQYHLHGQSFIGDEAELKLALALHKTQQIPMMIMLNIRAKGRVFLVLPPQPPPLLRDMELIEYEADETPLPRDMELVEYEAEETPLEQRIYEAEGRPHEQRPDETPLEQRMWYEADETPPEQRNCAPRIPVEEYCSAPKPGQEVAEECGICRGDLSQSADKAEEVGKTKCGHDFCVECLDIWVNGSGAVNANRCPMCRTVICRNRDVVHMSNADMEDEMEVDMDAAELEDWDV